MYLVRTHAVELRESRVVESNSAVREHVSVLRKALGERATGQQYIETVPRVGYRFAVPVESAGPQTGPRRLVCREGAAGNPVLHDQRRCPTRLCEHRQRIAAREGIELADPLDARGGAAWPLFLEEL
jgi:hypothetical protein